MTSNASPTAASQAANTSRIMGIMNDSEKWELRTIRVVRINMESIIPSKHRSDDIRCDR